MKIKMFSLLLNLLILNGLSAQAVVAKEPVAGSGGNGAVVTVAYDKNSPQQNFGMTRLVRALSGKKLHVELIDQSVATGSETISVVMVDAASQTSIKKEGFTLRNTAGSLGVSAIDQSGAMYGILELADMIALHGRANVPEKTVNPRFPVRAVKFNTPWSSYRRHESLQLHEETARDLTFWEGYLDMLAENRFNVFSLWTMHPYTYMVRPTNYPLACPFNDEELAEWQSFFHTLFRMAKDRGLDTYLINWNIFVSQGFIDHYDSNANDDIVYKTDHHNSPVVEKYSREVITQVLNEYPELTGLAINLGEGMGGMTPLEREEWTERVVLAGIADADRPVKVIHRAPNSAGLNPGGSTDRKTELLTRKVMENIDSEGPVWLELKFNWSHGHSTTNLVQVHGGPVHDAYWSPPPVDYAINWMMRNEDFYVLRWGQPDFIRDHIRHNGHSYVGGYWVGSEDYIPAKDYIHIPGHEHINWTYAWERQWLFYMEWGRLLYDPEVKDEIFEMEFDRRFGSGVGVKMVQAYKLASNMPLRFASLVRSTWDFTLYSEGFLAPRIIQGYNDRTSAFLSIEELMNHNVLDPMYLSVKDYVTAVKDQKLNKKKITPLALADELQQLGEQSLAIVQSIETTNPTLECEIMDVKAWSYLSLYFADKLRAAVALETFRVVGSESEKEKAVSLLKTAKQHWIDVVKVTKSHHQAIPLAHTMNTRFSWEIYLPDVERDIRVAAAYGN